MYLETLGALGTPGYLAVLCRKLLYKLFWPIGPRTHGPWAREPVGPTGPPGPPVEAPREYNNIYIVSETPAGPPGDPNRPIRTPPPPNVHKT